MVNIFGNWGRIRTWINKRIRIQDTGNTFVGEDSGKIATGDYNNFMGYQAGLANTSGYSNNFVGYQAGLANIDGIFNNFMGHQAGLANIGGDFNNFIGHQAGLANTSGYSNNFMGFKAGYSNTTGYSNTFIGHKAGYSNIGGYFNNFIGYEAGLANTSGYSNTFIGYKAGYSNTTGVFNNFIGHKAGYYETGNNKLFIDSISRANEADARIKALVYGVFDAAIANQIFRINGKVELTYIPSGSTQANAGATVNQVWRTFSHATLPDNVLMMGV